jgi:hypothetical protein
LVALQTVKKGSRRDPVRARRREAALTWTADGVLRQVVYEGLREDKAARDVRRE